MLIVADNLQITNGEIARAVRELDPKPIRSLVERCEEKGAQAIDINSGPLGKNAGEKMAFLVQTVQDAVALPLVIDTANPEAMEAGLAVCKNRAIINGFSLEPMKLNRMLPLAAKYDADIIGYLLNADSSVPQDADQRLAIAVQLLDALEREGIAKERLIVDPVVVPISWDQGKFQAREVCTVLRLLPEVLGYSVRTIAGLSNLTSGPGPREKQLLLERIFLSILSSAHLTMVLMNIWHGDSVAVAKACTILQDDGIFAWETI